MLTERQRQALKRRFLMFEMILLVWLVGVADPASFHSQNSYDTIAACESQLQPRAQEALDAFLEKGVPVAKTNTVCREVVPQGALT
jgi:hypothetical protein